jgi:diguanylate cyclase (GGDEF)-like protein/PAS domain S-box-containing protein
MRAGRVELGVRYRDLLDHLPAAAIYVEELDGPDPVHDVSAGITDLLGITPEEWAEGISVWLDAIHPDDRDRVIAANARSDETGEPFHAEYRAVHRDGREVWVRDDAVLVHDGDRRYWLGVMLDVSDLVTARQELEHAENRYGALVEQIPAIVYVDVADEHMTSTYVSPQIREILGVEPREYLDDPDLWASMLHPEDREEAVETYLRGRASGRPFTFEYRLIARDGRTVWFRDSAVVLHDPDGRPALIQGVMLDITDRREAERQVAFLAYHDKLTGLPNRVFFEEMLELGLARAKRHGLGVAVVAFDLDDFKLVNDSLGHEAGDALLVALAERLSEATRETDLVARPGGDELLLLLTDVDLTPPVPGGEDGAAVAAGFVAARVQEAMRAPFVIGGTELYLTGSMGISTFPADAEDAAELMKNADVAMFRSKKAGPGGYALHRAGDGDAIELLSLTTRLRKAVEQQAWKLHYQPLIDLHEERAYGVEALIRWPEPGGGLSRRAISSRWPRRWA